MSTNFHVLLTNAGAALQTNAWQGGDKINLTHFQIGSDATEVAATQIEVSKPATEKTPISELKQKSDDAGVLEVICIIPPEVGGFMMNSIGLFTDSGILFAVASLPSDYKPVAAEGSSKETVITLYIALGSTESINLTIDPYKVIATQDWINNDSVPAKHMENFNNPHKVTIAHALAVEGKKEYDYRVPKGGIIMWSGGTNQIPTGWVLCDGSNGTPNLADRFVIGAGGAYAVGDTGGAVDKTTTTAGNHSHSFSQTTSSNGNHTHSFSQTTSSNGNHAHRILGHTDDWTLSVSQIPAHNHLIGNSNGAGNDQWSIHFADRGYSNNQDMARTQNTGNSQAHRHRVDFNSQSTGAHTHSVSGNTNTTGAHTHSVSGNTNTTGNHSHKVNVLPPYYALAFIMKL